MLNQNNGVVDAERCRVSVHLIVKKSPLASFLTIECPSSVAQQLVNIIHEHYIEQIDLHGAQGLGLIALAAYLTPKYWDL